jgi:hypothetical protein
LQFPVAEECNDAKGCGGKNNGKDNGAINQSGGDKYGNDHKKQTEQTYSDRGITGHFSDDIRFVITIFGDINYTVCELIHYFIKYSITRLFMKKTPGAYFHGCEA